MAINFVEKYEKSPGLWIVRVTNDAETETLFLKFDHEPTLTEARTAAGIAIDAIIAQRQARQTDNDDRKTLLDYVYSYNSVTWTNQQKQTLLDALVARIKIHTLR